MPKSSYDFTADLRPIIEGDVPLPNFTPVEPRTFLDAISACGHRMEPRWGHALIDGRKRWAQFFLTGEGMGSPPHTYGGGGYVVAYGGITGTFKICNHQRQLAAGADPSRGWRPGQCVKCGIDMTVDSGD